MNTIRWSYAINQYKPQFDDFVRREDHERALKTMSIAGFEGVELTTGTGRWEPLGNPTQLVANFGSLSGFRAFLDDCKIDAVSSWFFDPHQRVMEDLTPALSPLVAADRERHRRSGPPGTPRRWPNWVARSSSPAPPRPPGTAARSMTRRWAGWPIAGPRSDGRPWNWASGPPCTSISCPRCGSRRTWTGCWS